MSLKYILSLIYTGEKVDEPVRLEKQEIKTPLMDKLCSFSEQYFYFIALASILFMLIAFVIACFIIIGSATESGVMYNHFNGVI